MKPDLKLSALLRQWPEIEPAANFDAQVWRQIRQPAPQHVPWFANWLPQPAFALTTAVVAGLVIGLGSGLFSVPAISHIEQLSFLAPNTLAGALRR